MQVIDQVESTDVDATDADDVDFAGNDGHDVDGVVAERNDEWGVSKAETFLENENGVFFIEWQYENEG